MPSRIPSIRTPMHENLCGWMRAQTWPELRLLVADAYSASFWHPYGFVVIRLRINDFPGWGMRLHLWPSTEEPQATQVAHQQVHSHGWDLLSRTLLGEVCHRTFIVDEVPKGCKAQWCKYLVESDYTTGVSTLRHHRCGFRVVPLDEHASPLGSELTVVSASDFHSTTVVPSELPWAVTLAATAHRGSEPSVVVSPHTSTEIIVNERRPVLNLIAVLGEIDDAYVRVAG